MPQSATSSLVFPNVGSIPLQVDLLGGRLTSDGGLPWLAEADAALALTQGLARSVKDWRRRRGRHELRTLLAQRIYQIACGYADQNDADTLRSDPVLKQVCGRLPLSGSALASQPTFSRLENAFGPRDCYRMAEALEQVYLQERERDGIPTGSCSIWTEQTIRPMGARNKPPIMASTVNTCIIRCCFSMETPVS